jgi:hypothetical protein
VVPSRKACTISDCATLGSSVQREAPYEVPE